MSGLYEAAVKRGLITVEAATEEQSTIRYQSGYGDIEEAGLVIEAVFEDMQVKCDVLKALDLSLIHI